MREKPKNLLKLFNAIAFCMALLFLGLSTGLSFGQSITWQRTYDGVDHLSDGSFGVCKADGDNIYVAGYTTLLPNRTCVYILKLNSFGDTIWTRTISPNLNSNTSEARAITSSGDGGCVVTGSSSGSFTIKLDLNGNIIWNFNYGGGLKQCYSIIKTSDGGYIACGRDAECSTDCGYILKIDSVGSFEWQQTYPAGYSKYFYSITETNDNSGYIAAGFDKASISATTKGYIVKINYAGGIIWERRYLIEQNSYINSISNYNKGYLIAGGTVNSSLGIIRLFFGKLNELGDTSSIKIFETNSDEYFGDFNIINDNKFVLSSSIDSITALNGHIFTFDSLGTILTNKVYITKDAMHLDYILPLNNGDIIFGGGVDFDPIHTREDIYVLRTDSLLNAPPPIAINNQNISVPVNFKLYQNFPNPFNPVTKIFYEIYKSTNIKLSIFDINGQIINILENSNKSPGKYSYELNAVKLNLASGVYFVKLESNNNFNQSIKIILIK